MELSLFAVYGVTLVGAVVGGVISWVFTHRAADQAIMSLKDDKARLSVVIRTQDAEFTELLMAVNKLRGFTERELSRVSQFNAHLSPTSVELKNLYQGQARAIIGFQEYMKEVFK